MGKFIDLTGKTFGRLTVISRGKSKGRNSYWNCICDCGRETLVRADTMKEGNTKSCGCFAREASDSRITHGHSITGKPSRTYCSWSAMRQRTQNQNIPRWKDYGGRGIRMTFRWAKFDLFLVDMGERPENTSIDRIDNEGHYEKSNCQWSTPTEQNNNMRKRSC